MQIITCILSGEILSGASKSRQTAFDHVQDSALELVTSGMARLTVC